MTGKKIHARLRLATVHGRPIEKSLARKHAARATRRRRAMHRQKIISSQLLAFPSDRFNHGPPRVLGDSFSGLPFLDGPSRFTDGVGHLGDGLPALKQVVDSLHIADIAPDELSGQARIKDPVNKFSPNRTIRPMGRGCTSPKLINEICERTRAARLMAGFSDRDEFARRMGVKPDTYARYESRLPMPHRYFGRFVELTGADLNVVLTGHPRVDVKKAG